MKKWAIGLVLIVAFLGVGIQAQAGCRVVSQQQATAMMIDDMSSGATVLVKAGTKVDRAEEFNILITVVVLNGVPMAALTQTVSCK